MKDKNTNESELIEELKQRFGVEFEYHAPSKEEEQFLEERQEVYELYCWNFDAFVQHYQLIKKFGLEEKGLSDLAWKIVQLLEPPEIDGLKKTEFYNRFGEHRIIQNALIEREINKETDEFFRSIKR
ncbi:MAG: hypothetical protein HUJ22_12900 [Gracilimonas sp.]|uniref:hypothetical protein n=1 Tax=Gracilimonas sp. TaxID=1974203 RepID=UPI0019AEF565|nr:hypothetical protein [Gracilimonas sp.]MBD3617460.1 hypothetical protein [Gracilimonas sp.]